MVIIENNEQLDSFLKTYSKKDSIVLPILSDDKKMSKSIGNILDPIEIINNYGTDQFLG